LLQRALAGQQTQSGRSRSVCRDGQALDIVLIAAVLNEFRWDAARFADFAKL
jgi:hypothetical protein